MKTYNETAFTNELEKLFDSTTKSKRIYEAAMYVENKSGSFSWSKGYGNKTLDSIINLTSVTKLFTTTCILNLYLQKKLSLDDKLTNYFGDEVLAGIHVYKGKDYSHELTVRNLLFQNSGIPDVYAAQHNRLNKLMFNENFPYTSFEEYVRIAKESPKKFAPGTPGKAHYSDLHFEMLGKIICQLEHSTLQEAYQKYVFEPLGLQSTYLYEKKDQYCNHYYYKDKYLYSPELFLSIPGCGGGMSTLRELMKFLKAFFGGKLFDSRVFDQLMDHAGIQYSPGLGQYCGGFVRLNIAGIASMFRLKGEMIGHMGGSGAFAYYYPQMDIFVVGDVNQAAKPGLLFTLPLNVAKLADRYMNRETK